MTRRHRPRRPVRAAVRRQAAAQRGTISAPECSTLDASAPTRSPQRKFSFSLSYVQHRAPFFGACPARQPPQSIDFAPTPAIGYEHHSRLFFVLLLYSTGCRWIFLSPSANFFAKFTFLQKKYFPFYERGSLFPLSES